MLPENFIDSHGLQYPDGILTVTQLSYHCVQNGQIVKQFVNGEWQTNASSEGQRVNINFRAGIFVNQQAKDEGKNPVPLYNSNGDEDFFFTCTAMPATPEDMIAECKHRVFSLMAEPVE